MYKHSLLMICGGRAFNHAGLSARNSLPDHLKDNTLSLSTFRDTSSNISTSCSTRKLSAFTGYCRLQQRAIAIAAI